MELPKKALRALEMHAEYEQCDIESSLLEYKYLLDTLIHLHDTLAELKLRFPLWMSLSDNLITKFYLHSISYNTLLCGTIVKSNFLTGPITEARILDVSSARILQRAQVECLLMYHHLYVNPKSDAEKEFRHDVWVYSSLMNRQSFAAQSDFAAERKANDRLELDKLEVKISASPHFVALSPNQQKELLRKGHATLFKNWKDILSDTGLAENYWGYTLYKSLAGNAHSEALSIIQIAQSSIVYSKNNAAANTSIQVSKQLVCLMINAVKGLYSVLEEKYNTLDEDTRDTIEIYVMMATSKTNQSVETSNSAGK